MSAEANKFIILYKNFKKILDFFNSYIYYINM